MPSNDIEQIIGDIQEYIDGCKLQPFSNTKIVVEKPELEQYLDDLRAKTPEEVKKYRRLLNNREKVMNDAKKRANEIEAQARAYAEKMVSESQITQLAYDKANEVLKSANEEANRMVSEASEEAKAIRQAALAYTNEMLSNLQSIIGSTIDDTQVRFQALFGSLNDHLTVVNQNQKELNGMNSASNDDDYNFFEREAEFPDDDEE